MVTWEMGVVFAVVVTALVLFATERFSVDQVAIAIPVVLLMAGILTPEEAISGFANVATVTVAAMLVLSLGLVKTEAVAAIGRWAQSAPLGGPRLRLAVMCLVVAGISPFLNNTPIVVVFLPIFLALAKRAGAPPSQYLIPLSYAAILGGTITLIGTSTNLIVYGMARSRGLDELHMFSIAPLGLIYLAVGLTYLFTAGRWLLPSRPAQPDLSGKYNVRQFVTELAVTGESPAAGRSLAELRWGEIYGVSVLGLHRPTGTRWSPGPQERLRAGDLLYAQGHHEDLLRLAKGQRLGTPADRSDIGAALTREGRLVELLVGPGAVVAGRTLQEVRFQQRFDATVLAIQHLGRTVRERLAQVRIEPGDLLLVHGSAEALQLLPEEEGLVPVSAVEARPQARPRALFAIAIMAMVVALAGSGMLPILEASLIGVVLMVFTRCVRLEEVYREIDWMIVFLLAGVLPLGIAMDNTGAAAWLGHGIAATVGTLGPVATIAAFYLITSILTEIMSNNAAAAVLTPIALGTAAELGVNPYALLVAIMFGASASFMTPVGYQTNTLVYAPGGYRFADFLRVGAPLNALLLLTATLFIPIFWPS